MRLPSYAYLLIVLVLAALSGWAYTTKGIKYGLDIQGGTRLIYSLDFAKLQASQTDKNAIIDKPTIRRNTIDVLERRVSSALGVAEATVQAKGDNQVIIELPGETDIKKAKSILGTSAAIEYYHATNVVTRRSQVRRYDVDGDARLYKDVNAYYFRLRTDANKVIEPGTPEYKQMIAGWRLILRGADLKSASVIPYKNGYAPSMHFSADGAKKMETWCRQNMNSGENLAAVLDGIVLSIAPIQDNTIITDEAFISGEFEVGFVKQLVNLLNSGALPVDLVEESAVVVDPTIGKSALNQIMFAGGIALAFTALFAIVYYAFPGVVAVIGLGLYALFTLTTLKLLDATFSLAAIAGFILSVGMAIDANILIFERVKEELKAGKTIKSAVELGFKRAFGAILDSNVCTIITSFVLMMIGTGPVKGFGSTLIIGVAISFFTAVVIVRWILVFLVGAGIGTNPKWYATERGWFGEHLESEANTKQIKIVEKRKLFFIISILTIIPGVIFYFMGGLKPNVEYLGGYEVEYKATNLDANAVRSKLDEAGFKGFNIKFAQADAEKRMYITLPSEGPLKGLKSDDAFTKIRETVGVSQEDVRGSANVGPAIQQESINNAIKGILLSSGLIILYLGFRFGFALGGFNVGLRFSMAAIIALLHDLAVVAGLAAIFGYLLNWELSALFITGMLTVAGFSTHDTIVIFDRIRENLKKPLGGEDIGHLINRSVTQSLARSINTSFTVIVTLVLLIAIGSTTPDLKFFNVVMLTGIISGTYSSIFNASPILYVYDRWIAKRHGEEKTLLGIARKELALTHVARVEVPTGATGEATLQSQAYGQVKRRRASASKNSEINIDDI